MTNTKCKTKRIINHKKFDQIMSMSLKRVGF